MEHSKINANSILLWLILLIMVFSYLIFGKPWLDDYHILECILSLGIFLFCLGMIAYRIINRTYLTSEGIICYRFWKIQRLIHWNEISAVCLISNYRVSVKSSNDSCIIIIPNGCVMYNYNQWSGIQYKFLFRHQIISIEDSFRNRQFINKHYGEIMNLRNGKSG